ncbi:MAG TPA: DAHL domain-containing protein [Noviherbaspirillum sp.]|nr:DAHL domain-containing protein [Noviherbaspirillum sp.]
MKPPRVTLLGLGFAVLLAISGYLYYQTQAINVDVQNQLVPALRELKQLDAEWNTNILKARVGLLNNYDPVTTPLPHVRQLRERLIRGVKMAHGGALEEALYGMEMAFVEKEELVEQFKSQNAVLRNSLRYFPTAVEEFKALLKEYRPGNALQPGRTEAAAAAADRLLTDILRFNLIPERELGERISTAIAGLDGLRSAHPDTLQESFELVTRHAQAILRQRGVEDGLIAGIVATPTAGRIDELSAALDAEFQSKLHEKQTYRLYLLVYSGILLALLTYAAWSLMHSYKVIARVNKSLQAANETLEQRVAERTAELARQSAQLEELATHDMLTGLINRRHLMTQIEQALLRAERRHWVVVLMFIDLDGFKAINDNFGHAAGDRTLLEVATRLKRHLRKEDAFARLGGDEFVILMNEVAVPHGATRVAEIVLEELGGLREIDGHPIQLSASIGIASVCGENGAMPSPETLLSRADHAMYRAKQQGKNCYRFDDESAWRAETVG